MLKKHAGVTSGLAEVLGGSLLLLCFCGSPDSESFLGYINLCSLPSFCRYQIKPLARGIPADFHKRILRRVKGLNSQLDLVNKENDF